MVGEGTREAEVVVSNPSNARKNRATCDASAVEKRFFYSHCKYLFYHAKEWYPSPMCWHRWRTKNTIGDGSYWCPSPFMYIGDGYRARHMYIVTCIRIEKWRAKARYLREMTPVTICLFLHSERTEHRAWKKMRLKLRGLDVDGSGCVKVAWTWMSVIVGV